MVEEQKTQSHNATRAQEGTGDTQCQDPKLVAAQVREQVRHKEDETAIPSQEILGRRDRQRRMSALTCTTTTTNINNNSDTNNSDINNTNTNMNTNTHHTMKSGKANNGGGQGGGADEIEIINLLESDTDDDDSEDRKHPVKTEAEAREHNRAQQPRPHPRTATAATGTTTADAVERSQPPTQDVVGRQGSGSGTAAAILAEQQQQEERTQEEIDEASSTSSSSSSSSVAASSTLAGVRAPVATGTAATENGQDVQDNEKKEEDPSDEDNNAANMMASSSTEEENTLIPLVLRDDPNHNTSQHMNQRIRKEENANATTPSSKTETTVKVQTKIETTTVKRELKREKKEEEETPAPASSASMVKTDEASAESSSLSRVKMDGTPPPPHRANESNHNNSAYDSESIWIAGNWCWEEEYDKDDTNNDSSSNCPSSSSSSSPATASTAAFSLSSGTGTGRNENMKNISSNHHANNTIKTEGEQNASTTTSTTSDMTWNDANPPIKRKTALTTCDNNTNDDEIDGLEGSKSTIHSRIKEEKEEDDRKLSPEEVVTGGTSSSASTFVNYHQFFNSNNNNNDPRPVVTIEYRKLPAAVGTAAGGSSTSASSSNCVSNNTTAAGTIQKKTKTKQQQQNDNSSASCATTTATKTSRRRTTRKQQGHDDVATIVASGSHTTTGNNRRARRTTTSGSIGRMQTKEEPDDSIQNNTKHHDINSNDVRAFDDANIQATNIVDLTIDTKNLKTRFNPKTPLRNDQQKLWSIMFNRLVKYKEQHGDTMVPFHYSDKELANWVHTQRRCYVNGELLESRYSLLQSIDFVWDHNEDQWMEMYNRLIAYKQQYRDTRVPQSYKDDDGAPLGVWVFTQRKSNKKKKLSNERYELLESIDFVWDARIPPAAAAATASSMTSGTARTNINTSHSNNDNNNSDGQKNAPTTTNGIVIYNFTASRTENRAGAYLGNDGNEINHNDDDDDGIGALFESGTSRNFPAEEEYDRPLPALAAAPATSLSSTNHQSSNDDAAALTMRRKKRKQQQHNDRDTLACTTRIILNNNQTATTTNSCSIGIKFEASDGDYHNIDTNNNDTIEKQRGVRGVDDATTTATSIVDLTIDNTNSKIQSNPKIKISDDKQRLWSTMFGRLVKYKEQHGHTMVPHPYTEDKGLAQWVKTQRRLNKNGELLECRYVLLKSIGFVWKDINSIKHREQWMEMYNRLITYRKEFKTTRVPFDYKESDGTALGMWVSKQRKNYKSKILSNDRYKCLKYIGFIWDATSSEESSSITTIHGDDDDNNTQNINDNNDTIHYRKMHYKLKQRPKKKQRAAASIDDGNDVDSECDRNGDDWTTGSWTWPNNDNNITFYRRNVTRPPKKQRTVVDDASRAIADITIADENNSKIQSTSNTYQHKLWAMMFDRLVKYKAQHGDTLVPYYFTEDRQLGKWVQRQRYYYKSGDLLEARYILLKSVDFVWDPQEDQWMDMYHRLISYKMKYKSTRVPRYYKDYNSTCFLGNWVNRQRRNFSTNTMSEKRYKLLDTVGFVWDATVQDSSAKGSLKLTNIISRKNTPRNFNTGSDKDGEEFIDNDDSCNGYFKKRKRKQIIRIDNDSENGAVNENPETEQNLSTTLRHEESWSLRSNFKSIGAALSLPMKNVPRNFDNNYDGSDEEEEEFVDRYDGMKSSGTLLSNCGDRMYSCANSEKQEQRECSVLAFHAPTKQKPGVVDINCADDSTKSNRKHREANSNDTITLTKTEASEQLLQRVDSIDDDNINNTGTSATRATNIVDLKIDNKNSKRRSNPKKPLTDNEQRSWSIMFDRLVKYKEQYGNTLVPALYSGDKKLGQWVRTQRKWYKDGILLEARYNLLKSIDFVWVVREDRWMDMYHRLLSYKTRYKSTRVPQYYKDNDGTSIGIWVMTQRANYSNNKISKEKYKLLDTIGFFPEAKNQGSYDDSDDDNKKKLAAITRHSSTAVQSLLQLEKHANTHPTNVQTASNTKNADIGIDVDDADNIDDEFTEDDSEEDDELYELTEEDSEGEADGEQLRRYERCISRKRKFKSPPIMCSSSSNQNTARIKSIVTSTNNKNKASSSNKIRRGVGNTLPDPEDDVDDVGARTENKVDRDTRNDQHDSYYDNWTTGSWTWPNDNEYHYHHDNSQRQYRAMLDSDTTVIDIADKEATSLDTKRPLRNDEQKSWAEMFNKLVEFKERHGHTMVRRNGDDKPLGIWVKTQRRCYSRGELLSSRYNNLKSIDFVWNAKPIMKEELWMHMFHRLLAYKEQYKHTIVPQYYKNDPQLGPWVILQRMLHRRNVLLSHRYDHLESIGFVWNDCKSIVARKQWMEMYQQLVNYKSKYGSTRVSCTNGHLYGKLGKWVSVQRICKRKNILLEERFKLLESLAFVWDVTN